jgi:hypothetical protein
MDYEELPEFTFDAEEHFPLYFPSDLEELWHQVFLKALGVNCEKF